MTKNLDWEILTKNLVTFKRWDWVEDEKFECYWSSLENLIFKGGWGGPRKTIYRGNCLKRGTWTVCRFRGRGLDEKEGVVFLRSVNTPMHIMEPLGNPKGVNKLIPLQAFIFFQKQFAIIR